MTQKNQPLGGNAGVLVPDDDGGGDVTKGDLVGAERLKRLEAR